MVVLGIPALDALLKEYRIIELEGDWINHVFELMDLLLKASRGNSNVYVVVVDTGYIDINGIYREIQRMCKGYDNIYVMLQSSLETLTINIYYMANTPNSKIFLILPYRGPIMAHELRKVSYVLNITRDLLSKRKSEIIILNPVDNDDKASDRIHLADIVLKLVFNPDGTVLIERKYSKPVVKVPTICF